MVTTEVAVGPEIFFYLIPARRHRLSLPMNWICMNVEAILEVGVVDQITKTRLGTNDFLVYNVTTQDAEKETPHV